MAFDGVKFLFNLFVREIFKLRDMNGGLQGKFLDSTLKIIDKT